jgi:chromosome segregation ATPase
VGLNDWLTGGGLVAGTGLVTVLLTKGIDAFRAKRAERREDRKQEHDLNKDETQQAFGMYKELLASLREEVKRLNENLRAQDDEHAQCRADNAKLTEDLGAVKSENAHQKAELEAVKARLAELEKHPVQ